MSDKHKLAYFSPLPPSKSGIADFSARIIPSLIEKFDIDIYTLAESLSTDLSPTDLGGSPALLDKHRPLPHFGDIVLYQIGSHRAHAAIYLTAILNPGVVMLHEIVLHHLVKYTTIGIGEKEVYTAEMEKQYGADGIEAARLVHTGRAANETLFFHYPLYERIVSRSRAVITTTRYSRDIISKSFPGKPVYNVPISVDIPENRISKEDAKKELGLQGEFLIGMFGLISETKEVDLLLDMIKKLNIGNTKLVLAGQAHPDYDLKKKIKEKRVSGKVIATGYLPEAEYRLYLAACDICANLRYPSGGESSAALLEMMAAGKAVIVPDYAQFLEFPSDSIIPLPLGRDKEETLIALIEHFNAHPDSLEETGRRAAAHARKHYSTEVVSGQLVKTLRKIQKLGSPEIDELSVKEKAVFEKLYDKILKTDWI